jgi:hypothetical protein
MNRFLPASHRLTLQKPKHIICRFLTVTASVHWSCKPPEIDSITRHLCNFWLESLHFFHTERINQSGQEVVLKFTVAEIEDNGWYTNRTLDSDLTRMIESHMEHILSSVHPLLLSPVLTVRTLIERNPVPSHLFICYRAWLTKIDKRRSDPVTARMKRKQKRFNSSSFYRSMDCTTI